MTDIKISLLNTRTWIRIAYMVLFLVLLLVARGVLFLLILIQTGIVLVSGADNAKLRDLGQSLSKWVLQTLLFVTFNSEDKSFPFDDWPTAELTEGYSVPDSDIIESVDDKLNDQDSQDSDEVPTFTDSLDSSETEQNENASEKQRDQ